MINLPLQIRSMTPLEIEISESQPKTDLNLYMTLDKIEIAFEQDRFNRANEPIKPNYKIIVEPSLWDRFVSWLGSVFN